MRVEIGSLTQCTTCKRRFSPGGWVAMKVALNRWEPYCWACAEAVEAQQVLDYEKTRRKRRTPTKRAA